MLIALIISIVAAIGLPVIVYKVQKYFSDKKKKELQDKLDIQANRLKGLEEKIDQMNRERTAAGNHIQRLVRTKEETKVLQRKIDKAHTDKEIEELLSYIDEDNNKVVRG